MDQYGYHCELEGPVPHGVDINCSVCFGIFRNPHLMGCCGQHVCASCIQKIESGSNLCPMCGRGFMSMLNLGFERQLLELEVSCVFKEGGCGWTGKLRGLDSHVAEDCEYILMECPWECGEKIVKYVLEEHKLSFCPKRPWYTCFKDGDLRRLAEKVDILSQEKQTLSIELTGLKEKLDRVEEEKEALMNEVNELRSTHSTDIQELRAAITALTTQCNSLKRSFSSSSLTGSSVTTKPAPDPSASASPPVKTSTPIAPTTFTVTEIKRRLKQKAEWYSPNFLSHPQGYNLQLRVDSGGVMDGKDTHVSVYVYIAKGDHDKNLKWPFEGSVTIRLLDPTDSLHHEKVVEFPKGTSLEIVGCVKEGGRAKRGQGYSQFLPLVDLKPYLIENTLNFEVDVSAVKPASLFTSFNLFKKNSH